jgi:arylsulfatase A-like enzyme
VVLAALAVAFAAGCGREDRPAGPPPRHVLLVSIDTLRADALACYGNAEARTEALDRLAAEGVRFEAAIAPSPVTLPSHASMLTGLDPWTLGILDNGIYRLAPEVDSLAEILAAQGFETAAFIGGYPLTADSERASPIPQSRAKRRGGHRRRPGLAREPGGTLPIVVHLRSLL